MTTQQYVYAALIAVQGALAGVATQGLLPGAWAAWAGVVGTIVAGLLQVLKAPKPLPIPMYEKKEDMQ